MTRTAAIIGGGIGGLVAAAHLRRHGWRVEVRERADALPATGTALGLWPAALRALDTIGVGDRVRELGPPQTAGALLRSDGRVLATLDLAALRRRTGDDVHLLSRPPLLRLLAEAAGPVRFGTPVTDLAEVAGYDVVIAADGINSRVRTALFGPRHRARYTGATSWRGTVDGVVGAAAETWGRGALFGITPQESGRTNWFASATVPAGQHRPGAELAELRARFGDWHHDVRAVLTACTEDTVHRADLHYLDPPLPSYTKGNVALIGDAAHAMPPNTGRGACEAVVDAVTLAEQLTAAPTVAAALARYDDLRRGPTQRLARLTRLVGRMARAQHLTAVRDTAVHLASLVA